MNGSWDHRSAAASARAMALLAAGVPLTLLIDLAYPAGLAAPSPYGPADDDLVERSPAARAAAGARSAAGAR